MMYKVSEFAEKAGVTVRTLHHYDRLGLLKPSGRSQAGYRLYNDGDFVRLQQIVTLKFIGLPLKDIKALLDGSNLDLKAALSLQRRLLTEKQRQLTTALTAIAEAEAEAELAVQSNRAPDPAALKKIIEVMERQDNMEWTKKYYSDAAQADIAERAKTFTPEMQAKVTQDWSELIRDVEAAIAGKQDPSGETAGKLAQRWSALVGAFTGGNPEVQKGLNKLYADKGNWPQTFKKPYSDKVAAYIKQAMNAHGISCG